MARPNYQVKQSYTGTGSLATYSFPFKIEDPLHLLIIEISNTGIETQRVRGDDNVYLSSLTFDSVNGGGSVTLAANLQAGYKLNLILANDAPTQPYEFTDKNSFKVKRFEMALDFILGAVQRLASRASKTVRINEADDETVFNPELPPVVNGSGKLIKVKDDGSGLEFGPASSSVGLPNGGDTGAVLVKLSPTSQDAGWDDLIIEGYSNRFGVYWSSQGLNDFITQLLDIVYAGPLIASFVGSSNVLREKGDTVTSINLTVTVTKRSNLIDRIRFLQGMTVISDLQPPSNTGSGSTVQNYTVPFSDNITFTVEVTDASGGGGPTMVSANVTYSFVYPYYHGCGAPGRTASQVAAMSKSIINSNANLNRSFTSLNGDVYYFAYPTSYGALTSILDENGFETFADWTLRTENITGLDGNPVSYRIYESDNPVVAGSTNFTFKR